MTDSCKTPLIITCVNAGDYLGCGQRYVETLAASVARNLSSPHEFHCFTDDPAPYADGIVKRAFPQDGLDGWWNKIALFMPGLFPDGARILYFDLDTVITGGLDDIAGYDGEFAMLGQFFDNVSPLFAGPQSGVMAWAAGFGGHIWQTYVNTDYPHLPGGDQAFLRSVHPRPDLWQAMYPGQIVSMRAEGGVIGPDACIVCFHGALAPHHLYPDGWEQPGRTVVGGGRKQVGGYWWPETDRECWWATLATADDHIGSVMRHVPQDRRRACVQAGGNVGVYPAKLAPLFGAVHTMEPDPANFACLKQNVEAGNVYPYPVALTNSVMVAPRLAVVPENVGQTHVNGGGIAVTPMRIDDLGLAVCDLIYLDIEGFEKSALEGAAQTIRSHRPVIAIEDNGLSERYGVSQGATPQWLIDTFDYHIAARIGRDVILAPI